MSQRSNPYARHTCPDCGVLEGDIHTQYCDQEECPFCGWQLLSCDCKYKKLKLINRRTYTAATHFLPPEIFHHGLSDEQRSRWETILAKKGYVPFIVYPNLCIRCGMIWPDMFHAHDGDWEYTVQKSKRHEMLCKRCYEHINKLLEKALQEWTS